MPLPSIVINLDERPDRLQDFYSQFPSDSLRPERMSADKPTHFHDVTLLSVGQLGCWNSHLNAMRKLVSSSATHLVIFEDDASLTQKGLELVTRLSEDKIEGIDLLQLGYLTHWGAIEQNNLKFLPGMCNTSSGGVLGILCRNDRLFRRLTHITLAILRRLKPFMRVRNFSFLKKCSPAVEISVQEYRYRKRLQSTLLLIPGVFEPGSHAYIISRRLAKDILESIDYPTLTIDAFYMGLSAVSRYTCFRLSKSIVNQSTSPSSIKPQTFGERSF